jgi:hypothetical protein
MISQRPEGKGEYALALARPHHDSPDPWSCLPAWGLDSGRQSPRLQPTGYLVLTVRQMVGHEHEPIHR